MRLWDPSNQIGPRFPLDSRRLTGRGELGALLQRHWLSPCAASPSRTICSPPIREAAALLAQGVDGSIVHVVPIDRGAKPCDPPDSGYLCPARSKPRSCCAHHLGRIKDGRLLGAIDKNAVDAVYTQADVVIALGNTRSLESKRAGFCFVIFGKDLAIAEK